MNQNHNKAMEKLPSCTFCVLPWMHLATNSGGNIRLCCNSTPGKNLVLDAQGKPFRLSEVRSVKDFWNVEWMKDIRRQMLKGERPGVCERCFREEDAGVRSARQGWNERYYEGIREAVERTTESGEVGEHIEYVDLRLGNLCNLRCVMCNPYASNQWVKDWNQVYPQDILASEELKRLSRLKWFETDQVWKVLEEILPTVKEIYLTGGEPTLARKQFELLQKCIDQGYASKITLKYNTNLVHLPEKLLEYWKHFDIIRLNVSIDGYGSLNELIRYPSKWSDIHQNLSRLNDLAELHKQLKVSVHTTVQVYNIWKLADLFDYLRNFKNIQKFPYLNILNHPRHLNIRILKAEEKEKVVAIYEKWFAQHSELYDRLGESGSMEKLKSVLKYMTKEDWSKEYEEFEQFDQRVKSARKSEELCL